MSVVGNFNYGSYDRQEQQSGAALRRRPSFSSAQGHVPDIISSDRKEQFTEEIEEFVPTREQRHAEVVQLARQISRQSTRSSIPRASMAQSRDHHGDVAEGGSGGTTTQAGSDSEEQDIFNYEPGSDLDPYSDIFNIHKWTRNMISIMNAGHSRVSGIAYRNMSVHGFGSDAGELDGRL